ncbi:MAG: TlpA family protein disulfide reductase [Propionibacteriaceae bacterium]|nr:TlpA family protein disulfide reductase [Propionibacteriaceae bacterium]
MKRHSLRSLSLSKGRAWLVASTALLMIFTGCAAETSRDSSEVPTLQPSPPTVEQLAAQKAAAGIPDCPESDWYITSMAGGLPDEELSCLGGGRSVRLAGLRGTPMIINVWAQWCGPCREEAPHLAEFAAETDPSTLMVLGIDFDDPRPELAIEFAQLSEWKYPQLQDNDAALRESLQIAGPPQTFFVTADGTIAYRHAAPFTSTKQIQELAKDHLGIEL